MSARPPAPTAGVPYEKTLRDLRARLVEMLAEVDRALAGAPLALPVQAARPTPPPARPALRVAAALAGAADPGSSVPPPPPVQPAPVPPRPALPRGETPEALERELDLVQGLVERHPRLRSSELIKHAVKELPDLSGTRVRALLLMLCSRRRVEARGEYGFSRYSVAPPARAAGAR